MPAESPVVDGVLRLTVTFDGADVSAVCELVSVTIRRAINRVPTATLVLLDGDMPEQSMPQSDAATYLPGASVEVKAGYGDAEQSIFQGIVVRHGVSMRGGNDGGTGARLTLECRDKAVKMTVARSTMLWTDKTDSDILQELIDNHGLQAEVDTTTHTHKQIVQHYCTDWDFLVSRAEANGLLVMPQDGKLVVAAPASSSEPVLLVGWGKDILEFQADLDARHQFSQVKTTAWDPSTQAVVNGTDASPDALTAQGDLTASTLAQVLGLSSVGLQTTVPLEQTELTGWAKAQQVKSSLARVRGYVRFQGSALAQVGAVVSLEGVGTRFSGKVLTTALTHTLREGEWTTEVEFGHEIDWFTARTDIVAPAAAGRLPGIEGLFAGVVAKLDADPQSQHRIQVNVPSAGITGVWARLAQTFASNSFGAFFVPEVGDEVLLGWFNNDPAFPVVLGCLYSSKQAPPYTLEAANNTKAIVTRCKSKLEFNEEDKVITLVTPGKNQIVISDKDKSITLTDQNNNKVELAPGGITLDSPKDITIKAKGKITLDAVGEVGITSKADVKVAGLNINCTAQVGFAGKGSATAELSASGQTTVKGAIVMIN